MTQLWDHLKRHNSDGPIEGRSSADFYWRVFPLGWAIMAPGANLNASMVTSKFTGLEWEYDLVCVTVLALHRGHLG